MSGSRGHTVEQRDRELPWAEIFASTPLALAVVDAAAERILYVTPAYAELHGYEPEALIGGAVARMYAAGALEALEAQLRRMAHERAIVFQADHRRRDGSTFPARMDARAVVDDAGAVCWWVVTVEDLTAQQESAERQARLAAIVESSVDAVVGSTVDGIVTSWNAAAERLFGHPAAEMVGRPLARIIPPERLDEDRDILARLARGERISHFETERLRRDGSRVAVSLSVSPLRTAAGRVIGGAKIIRDITRQKAAEAAQRFLAEASVRLAESLDVEDTLRALARLAIEEMADGCMVTLLDEAAQARGEHPFVHVEVASRLPGRAELVREMERRFPLAPDAPSGHPAAIRTGRAELVPPEALVLPAVARGPEHLALLRAVDMSSGMVVPLLTRGRPLGAITLVRHGSERRPAFTERDLAVAEELGRRAGVALDNARLYATERAARADAERAVDRARRLQRLTAALNEAVTQAEIADVLLEGGLAATGADAGSVALVLPDAEGRPAFFETIRTAGYGPDLADRYHVFPIQSGRPLSVAVLEQRLVAIASPEEWRTAFTSPEDLTAMGFAAFVAIPVVVGGRAVGAISFSFRAPQAFDEATETFLATLGEQCALALERARAHEAELRLAERHATLLETIQDAFVALDGELRYTYVNARAEALMRRAASTMLGRTVDEVFGTQRTPIREAMQRVLATREGAQVEAHSPVTGTWVEARLYPAPDGGVSLVFQDVTARRRQQEASAFLAEASALLAASLDVETTLRTVAEAAVPRLGDWCAVSIVADPVGRPWPPMVERVAVVHRDPAKLALGREVDARWPTDWDSATGVAAVLRDGTPFFVPRVTDEMLVAGARDAEHLAMLRALAFSSVIVVPLGARGLMLGTLMLCTSESGRLYDDDDLALAQDLAQRAAVAVDNARLYREAERARAEAEAASQAKSEFLAVMSHELRTPLNAVIGYQALLADGLSGPVTELQQAQLGRIRASAHHLLHLVDEVLTLSRLEARTEGVRLERVDVGTLVAETVALVEPSAAMHGLRLTVDVPPAPLLAHADAMKLRQVLLNLLSNATKFTARGAIAVRARAAEHDDEPVVLIAVRDTGVGIAPEHLERIFEPFWQVEQQHTRTAGGTGLGLAVSRQLARLMGGDVTVESQPGQGSTFVVRVRSAGAS